MCPQCQHRKVYNTQSILCLVCNNGVHASQRLNENLVHRICTRTIEHLDIFPILAALCGLKALFPRFFEGKA